MNPIFKRHTQRLETSVLNRYTSEQIAKWITENTKYAGEPYSYKDHEYQEKILNDNSKDVCIRKCSQVGISEASARMALALVNVLSPYTVAYTLPTALFASKFTTTRIDPVVVDSDDLKNNVSKINNNSEVKQFGYSYLWVRGAASSNAPISIPCDHLIHDEVDFSDQEVLSQYVSRLTHSKYKRTHRISTPTLPGFGIDKAFQESRRHFLMCQCNHCNFYFIPSYDNHVRVPGWTKDIREITKANIGRTRYKEAFVECPNCGKAPSLQVEHREWVVENPDDGFEGAGYQVSPFDAPNVISPGYLIEASTRYERRQDHDNFSLGLPSEDLEATLTRADMIPLFLLLEPPRGVVYVMGIDVGNTYHFAVGAVDGYGDLVVVHVEKVPMGNAKTRYHELRAQYRVAVTVIDSGPHAETVMSLQEKDPNCYASVYMRSKSILTHNVVFKDSDAKEGVEFVRQVNVNRNRAFDAYMNFIRENHLVIKLTEDQEEIIQHHTSMKRVKVFDNDSGEMTYSWQKTDGVDHFHHTFLYLYIAAKIRGLGRPAASLPLFQMFSFRQKT